MLQPRNVQETYIHHRRLYHRIVATMRRQKSHGITYDTFKRTKFLVAIVLLGLLCHRIFGSYEPYDVSSASSLLVDRVSVTTGSIDPPNVDDACKALPFIRPTGSYFLNDEMLSAKSPEGVSPPFQVGSFLGEKATYHMNGDKDHFELIKEFLQGKEGGLSLDIGANQGFFTYYLAALGMEVHSFEILDKNIIALQHGAEYNSKEISRRVHLYPVRLGSSTGRLKMTGGGSNYEGYIKKGGTGPILGTTYDCFAYHNLKELGNDIVSNVAFMKLDVEGFEIAALAGAKNSIFGPNGWVGALLMEVGPNRWNRAGIDFATGLQQMIDTASHGDCNFWYTN